MLFEANFPAARKLGSSRHDALTARDSVTSRRYGQRPRNRGSVVIMDRSSEQLHQTEDAWRERLSAEEYAVLRQGATERPWSGEYVSTSTVGVYRCRACGAELFRSATKFESHCGWPSFYDPSDSSAVTLHEDRSLGMIRTEVRCARCDSHLGHVFRGEGYDTPTDDRYCINSIALTLEEDGSVQ